MRIYICRHAQAVPTAVSGRDLDRPLTRHGQLQARYLASVLGDARGPERPRGVLASPAARTQETAQSIADELGFQVATHQELAPDQPPGVLLDLIDAADDLPVVLVGHNPTVSALVSLLASGIGPRRVALDTGQMAVLRFDGELAPGEGELVAHFRYDAVHSH
ncbi:MAG: histidine phosphatase family protein [Planctomycetota bacterium]